MGTMERYSKVGMQELDQRLSKIVEAARKKPVSVYRYGAPWVWIVSQDDWQARSRKSPATSPQAIHWSCCARRSTTSSTSIATCSRPTTCWVHCKVAGFLSQATVVR